jgi:hypothetical protein
MDKSKEEYRNYSKEIEELTEGLGKMFTTWKDPAKRARVKQSLKEVIARFENKGFK